MGGKQNKRRSTLQSVTATTRGMAYLNILNTFVILQELGFFKQNWQEFVIPSFFRVPSTHRAGPLQYYLGVGETFLPEEAHPFRQINYTATTQKNHHHRTNPIPNQALSVPLEDKTAGRGPVDQKREKSYVLLRSRQQTRVETCGKWMGRIRSCRSWRRPHRR